MHWDLQRWLRYSRLYSQFHLNLLSYLNLIVYLQLIITFIIIIIT